MTATSTLVPAELRAAARDHYREASAEGAALSGAELGRRFGMSERWGRDRVAEVHANPAAGTTVPIGSPGDMPDGNGGTADLAAGTSAHGPGTDPEGGSPADTRGGMPAGKDDVPPASDALAGPLDFLPIGKDDVPPASGPPAGPTMVVPVGTEAGRRVRVAIRWITTLTVVLVAACAARASYDHQRRFVEMAGETEAAWYLPLSVDGMMLVASLNMLVRRWDSQPAGWLTWCALALGGIASLAANVAAADPTFIGRAVAAWAPICLIVSFELLMDTDEAAATMVAALWRRIRTYSLDRRPRRIALNLLLDTVHDFITTRDRERAWSDNADLIGDDTDFDHPDDELGPSPELMWHAATTARVLTTPQATLLDATHLRGLTLRDTAALLGMAEDAARKSRKRSGVRFASWWVPDDRRHVA